GGEARTRGLGVEPKRLGAGLPDAEHVAGDPSPQASGRPELGDLLEEVAVGREEEGEPGKELVQVETALAHGPDVGDRVREGEGDLLDRRRARLPHVVAGDR